MARKKLNCLRHIGCVVEYMLVVPLATCVGWLPWSGCRRLAVLAGTIIYYLNRRGRRQALRNLDIIFASQPLAEGVKQSILRRLHTQLVLGLIEFFRIDRLTKENHHRFLSLVNYAAFERARAADKGVLIISAHLGNWEYAASIGAKLGNDIGAVIYRQDNPYTDKWLKAVREKKAGVKCFYNDAGGLPGVVRHLKNSGALALLADERHTFKPLMVPLCGLPCATAQGPARLHLRYGSPLVFCFAVRQAHGRYRLLVDGPYNFPPTGNPEADRLAIMTFINRKYERVIRAHPDQWFSLFSPRWESISGP